MSRVVQKICHLAHLLKNQRVKRFRWSSEGYEALANTSRSRSRGKGRGKELRPQKWAPGANGANGATGYLRVIVMSIVAWDGRFCFEENVDSKPRT